MKGSVLPITPCRRVEGEVQPPGSKSITNRALTVAALAGGRSILRGALRSEDTNYMSGALRRLGIPVEETGDGTTIEVVGCAGQIPAREADLYLGNSGTAIRFLCALLALGRGRYRLDGSARMRQRPIQDLLEALNACGCRARSERGTGCPPVLVEADGLEGGTVEISGEVSSQFLSGLLMASPYARQPMEIKVRGTLVSRPYVRMTVEVMRAFGARVEQPTDDLFRISNQVRYRGRDYRIEPDASSASYFLAAAAITGGRCRVEGIGRDSLQGDARFVDLLARMGAIVEVGGDWTEVTGATLRGIDADLNEMPDMALTLAAISPFATGPTTIRNVANLRLKESDRLRALANELRRIGQEVEEWPDGLRIQPRPVRPAVIETYNDHRMAMSFSLVGLRVPGIAIRNPSCVSKTFPRFFDHLERICRR